MAYGGIGQSNSGELREIDTSTRSVRRGITLPGLPASLALAHDENRLYITTRSGRDQLGTEPGPLLVVDLEG